MLGTMGTAARGAGRGTLGGSRRSTSFGRARRRRQRAQRQFLSMAAQPQRGAGAKPGVGAPVGAGAGKVGNLMVGAAVGLGGKLMRTVSFFGCTLPVDFFNGFSTGRRSGQRIDGRHVGHKYYFLFEDKPDGVGCQI